MAAVISSARELMGNSGGNSRRNGNGLSAVGVGTKRLEIRCAHRNDKPSMQQPPLLSEVTLVRVLRLARFDGMGALVLGGMFALVAAANRDFPFAAIGLLAAGAGAVELHGAALLREGEPRGMRWLL